MSGHLMARVDTRPPHAAPSRPAPSAISRALRLWLPCPIRCSLTHGATEATAARQDPTHAVPCGQLSLSLVFIKHNPVVTTCPHRIDHRIDQCFWGLLCECPSQYCSKVWLQLPTRLQPSSNTAAPTHRSQPPCSPRHAACGYSAASQLAPPNGKPQCIIQGRPKAWVAQRHAMAHLPAPHGSHRVPPRMQLRIAHRCEAWDSRISPLHKRPIMSHAPLMHQGTPHSKYC
jgi:hypothetical protein